MSKSQGLFMGAFAFFFLWQWIAGILWIMRIEKDADSIQGKTFPNSKSDEAYTFQLSNSGQPGSFGAWVVTRDCPTLQLLASDQDVEFLNASFVVSGTDAVNQLWAGCQISFAHAVPRELDLATSQLDFDGKVTFTSSTWADEDDYTILAYYSVRAHWQYSWFGALGPALALFYFIVQANEDDNDGSADYNPVYLLSLVFMMMGLMPEAYFISWTTLNGFEDQLTLSGVGMVQVDKWYKAVVWTFLIGSIGAESVILPMAAYAFYVVNGGLMMFMGWGSLTSGSLGMLQIENILMPVVLLTWVLNYGRVKEIVDGSDGDLYYSCIPVGGLGGGAAAGFPRNDEPNPVAREAPPAFERPASLGARLGRGPSRLARQMSAGALNSVGLLNTGRPDTSIGLSRTNSNPITSPAAATPKDEIEIEVSTTSGSGATPGGLLSASEIEQWKAKIAAAQSDKS